MEVHIKNLPDLINLNSKIISTSVKNLTEPGENYGSLMLSVDLKVENSTEDVHLVVKLLPQNQFIRALFNTDVTFRNEIGFYKYILPLLQNFQRERGVVEVIDIAPKYYGSRLNLQDDDSSVGEDAALVLENLKILKFGTPDRLEGLDMDAAELILSDLANLHATALALKLQKAEVFDKEIKPLLTPWKSIPSHYAKLLRDLNRLIDHTEELHPYKERIVKEFERQMRVQNSREPFATISHSDCWINNNLVKLEDGKTIKNKLVDFQMIEYGSPAKDVLFFIFTSVKTKVVEEHYDDLVRLYYRTFIKVLEELKCDIKEFSWENFVKEIDYEARNSQFAHIAFMLFPMYVNKDEVKDVKKMTSDNFLGECVSDMLKEKFLFVFNEFLKRKWIFN